MKHYSLRGICKSRVYTFKTAARIVGVSYSTFCKWPNEGLRVITDKTPYLVRGADLITFLTRRMAANRHVMAKDQIFCLRCKEPRTAAIGSLSFTPQNEVTGRLGGLCSGCGGKIGRFCSVKELQKLRETHVIAINARANAYADTPPLIETHTCDTPTHTEFWQGGFAVNSHQKRKETP
jgi:hypothetical protein